MVRNEWKLEPLGKLEPPCKPSLSSWSVILESNGKGRKSCDYGESKALSHLISEAEVQELMTSIIGPTH
jgi:hypothetical protein